MPGPTFAYMCVNISFMKGIHMFASIRRLAVAAALVVAPALSFAGIVSYSLAWTGAGGYSASGQFSFDTATIGGDNLITQADLTAFTVSFFDPTSTLLKTYSALSDAQLLAFHTDTLLIDQGPQINLILGRVTTTDYVLVRSNGCTGDQMVLYQGTGVCTGPNANFIDRSGVLTAAAISLPEPGPLALVGIALAGLMLQRRRA